MKRVFISIPMSGKENALIERSIQIAKAKYLHATKQNAKEVRFYDNYHGCVDIIPHWSMKIEALTYLSIAICELGKSDEAIFGPGWKEARGCRIEHEVCEEYNIPIYECE